MPDLFEMRIVRNDLPKVKAETRQGLRQLVRRTAANVEARAKVRIQTGPKTGRIYHKGRHEVSFTAKDGREVSFIANKRKRVRIHQASAPGESPASDTGHLANSIRSRLTGPLEAEVVVAAEYGGPLEFGGAKVAARPFLAPSMLDEWPAFEAGAAEVLRDAANG